MRNLTGGAAGALLRLLAMMRPTVAAADNAYYPTGYAAMGAALEATGRDIVYSCSWPAYIGARRAYSGGKSRWKPLCPTCSVQAATSWRSPLAPSSWMAATCGETGMRGLKAAALQMNALSARNGWLRCSAGTISSATGALRRPSSITGATTARPSRLGRALGTGTVRRTAGKDRCTGR